MSGNKSKEQTLKSVKEQAEDYFQQGDCCSEALVKTLVQRHSKSLDADSAKLMTTGLCGGMGNKQATCGVFTGGAVAISLLIDEAKDRKKEIKKLSADFHQQLSDVYQDEQCEKILKKMGLKNLNRSQCKKLTGIGAELVEKIVINNPS